MKKKQPGSPIFVIGVAVVLLVICALLTVNQWIPDPALSLVTSPADSIQKFLREEETKTEFFVVLLDSKDSESVSRYTEIFNAVVRKNKSGISGRILYAYPYDFILAQSELGDNVYGGDTSVVVSKSVLYEDTNVQRLDKPVVLLLVNGIIQQVLEGSEFDRWLAESI